VLHSVVSQKESFLHGKSAGVQKLQNEFMKIQESLGKTIMFVTHDINEAFKLGSRVMVMNEGKLLQFDTLAEIVKNPADSFVRSLIEAARTQEEFWENVR
jgi:osmoprotectant transport system ATP-binding protein